MKGIVYILAGMGINTLVQALGFDGGSWQYWVLVILISLFLAVVINIDKL